MLHYRPRVVKSTTPIVPLLFSPPSRIISIGGNSLSVISIGGVLLVVWLASLAGRTTGQPGLSNASLWPLLVFSGVAVSDGIYVF